MSRGQREGPGQPRRVWPVVLLTAVLSVVATAVALGALAVATRGPDPTGCDTVAWKAIPDAAALPSGWSMVSNQVFVDSLSTSLAGPTPSGSTERQAAFAGVSCFGSDAGLALRRAHEGALAAGGADVSFATVGDESFVVFSPAASTTTLYFRRGPLVADLTASTSVDRPTLEAVGRAVDGAMVRSLAVSADAAPLPLPSSTGPAASVGPADASPATSPGSPAPSASTAVESHDAPDLERLLPSLVGTTSLATQSVLGTTALGTGEASQALQASLKNLGKTPADLQIAGAYDPTGALDLRLFAYRVAGVDTTELARAVIESQLSNTAAQATSSQVTIGDHAITKISYAQGSPAYVYVLNGVVYVIQTGDTSLVSTVLGSPEVAPRVGSTSRAAGPGAGRGDRRQPPAPRSRATVRSAQPVPQSVVVLMAGSGPASTVPSQRRACPCVPSCAAAGLLGECHHGGRMRMTGARPSCVPKDKAAPPGRPSKARLVMPGSATAGPALRPSARH